MLKASAKQGRQDRTQSNPFRPVQSEKAPTLPIYKFFSKAMNLECPKLWHYDEEYGSCRPGIEHVDLQCSGDLIEVNFNNIIFNNENNITVNR